MHDTATICSTCSMIWRVCRSTAAVSIRVLVLVVSAAAVRKSINMNEGPFEYYSTAALALDLYRNRVLTNGSTPSVYVGRAPTQRQASESCDTCDTFSQCPPFAAPQLLVCSIVSVRFESVRLGSGYHFARRQRPASERREGGKTRGRV